MTSVHCDAHPYTQEKRFSPTHVHTHRIDGHGGGCGVNNEGGKEEGKMEDGTEEQITTCRDKTEMEETRMTGTIRISN